MRIKKDEIPRTAVNEPRHEKRDTNDICMIVRGGWSKLCMSICNVWHCSRETKRDITPQKRKLQL